MASQEAFRPFLLLVLGSFFFIGLDHVHLFDWDEINFAESAREMIVSGDYMKVQINFRPFWEKPPLFFWLQVLSMKIFGINEWAARFPNAVMGVVYILTLYYIGKSYKNSDFGWLWSLLFFGSLLPHLYFKSGIIDPVFNYFIFLSVYFLWKEVEMEPKNRYLPLLSGVFSGLSFLTKGPVGLLIVLIVVGSYILIKKFRYLPALRQWFQFASGFFLVVSAWLSVEFSQNGWENMQKFIQYQVELFTQPVATHGQPFYYHFVVVLMGCFPISILALPFLSSPSSGDKNLRMWMQILFWTVMILFSITTTKIVHYSSMAYLPLSFVAAEYIFALRKENNPLHGYLKLLLWIFISLWALIFFLLPLLIQESHLLIPLMGDPFAKQALKDGPSISLWAYLSVVFWIAGGVLAFISFKRNQWLQGVLSMSVGIAMTLLSVQLWILPKIESMTQGTHIEFLKSVQTEDVYISSYGFKSYAPYFYGWVKQDKDPRSSDVRWLIEGEIDKPVYLVTNKPDTELSRNNAFTLVKARGGFYIYRRDN